MSGSQTVGFDWGYSSIAYNAAAKAGEVEFNLSVYSNQGVRMKPTFRLVRMYENIIDMTLSEFKIQVKSAIKFHRYKSMLCFDIWTEIADFNLLTTVSQKFLECKKNLVFINTP